VANFAANAPALASITRSVLGIAGERRLPRFAKQSFQRWATRSTVRDGDHNPGSSSREKAQSVILWADTFNNYFHPETAHAAFHVLSAAGFNVMVPRQHLCCGRPLYDF